jgi:RNase P subunit RPR2
MSVYVADETEAGMTVASKVVVDWLFGVKSAHCPDCDRVLSLPITFAQLEDDNDRAHAVRCECGTESGYTINLVMFGPFRKSVGNYG